MGMHKERRGGMAPIPEKLEEVLNDAQLLSLNKLEGFGWSLEFVRRPLFQEVVPVLFHPDTKKYGILSDDGTLNAQPEIQLRSYGDSHTPDAPHQRPPIPCSQRHNPMNSMGHTSDQGTMEKGQSLSPNAIRP